MLIIDCFFKGLLYILIKRNAWVVPAFLTN